MAWAENQDLQKLRPDLFDDISSDYADKINLAQSDVLEIIKSDWFVKAAKTRFVYLGDQYIDSWLIASFDVARLNTALLKNLVCYRAMAYYIYPGLTRDTDDGNDAFTRRAERYMAFYQEELERVYKMPLYDFDGDSAFSDLERVKTSTKTVRISRA